MICATCIHAKPHLGFLVCRHPRVLAWQEKRLRCRIGLHVDIAVSDRFCGGQLLEKPA